MGVACSGWFQCKGATMARVKWVHERLDRWVAWRVSEQRGNLGWPRQSPFLREAKQNGYRESIIPQYGHEEAITNDAVESMRSGHGDLYDTLMLYYVDGRKTMAEKAHILGCSEAAIRARLERIDAYLVQWLSDHKHSQQARMQASV